MVMYSTLEDIQTGMQDSLFSDDQINLRSEQRMQSTMRRSISVKEVEEKGNISMPFLLNIASISGTPRCVLVKPSVPCSLCVN